jgi:oligopeptide/dipeptide ABC transporter ATP-binding protein
MDEKNVLEIRDLHTSFFTEKGVVRAVNGVDLNVPEGKIIGLVGESGCGKSMTARSVMGLVRYPGKVESGSIRLDGKELAGLKDQDLREVCGNDVSMIFQEPMTSLNPVLRVGHQVEESLLVHHKVNSRKEAKQEVIEMFNHVGIPEAEQRYSCYPHELSGGLRQRVMIAMAMICEPRLLIADEPTTALDVTVEAQILRLMKELCEEHGMSVLLITHNLGVVAEICDEVYVMYAGRIVEHASVFSLFDHTSHPYTKGLLSSIPRIGKNPEYLHTIPGIVPNLLHLPEGCPFSTRCDLASERCRKELPELNAVGENHECRCFEAIKEG